MQKKRFIVALMLIIMNTVLILFFVQASSDLSLIQAMRSLLTVGRRAHLFTFVLIAMSIFVLWVVSNRLFFSLAIHDSIFVVFSIANFLKVTDRNEQLLPSDLKFVTNITSLLNMISPVWAFATIIIGVLLLFLIGFSFKFKANSFFSVTSAKSKYVLLTIYLVLGGLFARANHVNSISMRTLNLLGDEYMPWDTVTHGPFLQFLDNFDVHLMDKPSHYDKSSIKTIVKALKNKAFKINRERTSTNDGSTIIYILSESLSNPNRLKKDLVKPNPLPFIDSLESNSQSVSGTMLSSGYGGGTANMEYMALTSLSITNISSPSTIAYTSVVPLDKHVETIASQFSDRVAIHPFAGNFYDRRQAYEKMGIQKYFAPDSKYKITPKPVRCQNYASDEYTYGVILSKILGAKQNDSQFIQVATMQNHADYKKSYIRGSSKVQAKSSDIIENKEYLQNYSDGIRISDNQTKIFLNRLNRMKRPVSVVFYGDHLPGIYSSNMVSKRPNSFHETDYFIWSNKASHVRKVSSAVTRFTSPNYFTSILYRRLNIKITPFQALLTELSKKIPATYAYSTESIKSTHMVNSSGRSIKYSKLGKSTKRLLNMYKLIQYDQTLGENYGKSLGMYKVGE